MLNSSSSLRLPSMRLLLALFAMSRPLQLVAVTLVYLMGTAISGYVDSSRLLWGFLALLPVSASIHYANEYADHETDALTTPTPFSGGSGALPRTGLDRHWALGAAWLSLAVGMGVAVIGWALDEMPLAGMGILIFGAFFGWMYSLPPFQLAWRGWGEVVNAMLGGIALPVYGFAVHTGRVDPHVIAASFPFGVLVFLNLLATQWPDRLADAQVGKYTLATRWSPRRLRLAYHIGVLIAFLTLILLTGSVIPSLVAYSSFLVMPLVIWGGLSYTRTESPLPSVAAMVLLLIIQLMTWSHNAWA